MKNLDSIHKDAFKCTVARKSRPELTRQGGLCSESAKFYEPMGGKFNKTNLVWTFPNSKAEISFLGVPDESVLGGLQGLQASRLCIDEVGDDWSLDTVLFLLSRLRSPDPTLKCQCIMSCNPNHRSFLKDWLEYCLDPETGVPIEGTEKIVRWMIVLDGKVYWGNSPEECFELHGRPRGMIMGLGMKAEEMLKVPADRLFLPKSFRHIPCGVYDNPYLLPPRNTSYLANLLAQPKKNQLKYLLGSWLNIDVGQGHFKRSWCKMIPLEDVPKDVRWVRAYDLAASEKSEANRNPDASVGVLMARDPFGHYYIVDMLKMFERPHSLLQKMIAQSLYDGQDIPIVIPQDGGGAGKIAAQHFVSVLSEAGCVVKVDVMSGHSGKLNRGLPFCQVAEAGMVSVVVGNWNDEYFSIMEDFEGTAETMRKRHDDEWDATSSGFKHLARTNTLPTFTLGNDSYTRPSPLG